MNWREKWLQWQFTRLFIMWVLAFALLISGIILMVSCRSEKEVVNQVDSVYIVHNSIDTLYIAHSDTLIRKDSVFVTKEGDNVTTDRWHYIYTTKQDTLYKYIGRTDTIVSIDSVAYPVEIEKVVEVEKGLNWWQTLLQFLGYLMLASISFCIFIGVRQIMMDIRK